MTGDQGGRDRSRPTVRVGDVVVPRLGVGTAPLAFRGVSRTDAVRTLHAALDAGARLIDTALVYTRPDVASWAEAVVALALSRSDVRQDVLVATKGGHHRDGDSFPVDASPARLRADCDASLRALQVDVIDLYQLHKPDPDVPLLDSVGALEELRTEGKIRHVGLSNVTTAQIAAASRITRIASVQNALSWLDATDLPTARWCAERGIAYLAYSPLTGADPLHLPAPMARAVTGIAGRAGCSPQRVQLAWLISRAPNVVPLVGTTRPATIEDSVAALDLNLGEDDLLELDAARAAPGPSTPTLGG